MAIAPTLLLANETTTDGTSATTASYTPGANKLITADIVTCKIGGGDTPTLSGNGLTWVQVATQVGIIYRRITRFRAMGASPSTGALTIDCAGVTQDSFAWSITEWDGIDTGGTNGSAAVVQSATGSGSGTTGTVTLAAFGSANNAAFGGFVHGANDATTPESGYTELSDRGYSDGGTDTALETEWVAGEDTSVTATWPLGVTWAGVAIEIKAAAPAFAPRVMMF